MVMAKAEVRYCYLGSVLPAWFYGPFLQNVKDDSAPSACISTFSYDLNRYHLINHNQKIHRELFDNKKSAPNT
jgi:hypothetical protein